MNVILTTVYIVVETMNVILTTVYVIVETMNAVLTTVYIIVETMKTVFDTGRLVLPSGRVRTAHHFILTGTNNGAQCAPYPT